MTTEQETQDEQVTSNEPSEEEIAAAEEAAFEAEFQAEDEEDPTPPKVARPEQADLEAPAPDDQGTTGEEGAAAATEETGETGVEPQEDDKFQELENRLSTRMRNIEGHFGGLKSQITAALEARQETQASGGEAPTQRAIQEASKSSAKLDALKADFPEWGEALDEQFADLEERVTAKVGNTGELETNLTQRLDQAVEMSGTRLREIIRVDAAYPDWEDTIETDKFSGWKAGQSQEVQDLADSPRAADAIKMLRMYDEYLERTAKKQAQTQRLEEAVMPTRGGTSQRAVGTTDEEDFLAAFNE